MQESARRHHYLAYVKTDGGKPNFWPWVAVVLFAGGLGAGRMSGTSGAAGATDPIKIEPVANLGKAFEEPKATEIVVHVVGAVNAPGMVRLTTPARVDDAIKKAGGARKDADLQGLNLAGLLQDGLQIRVPKKGDIVAAPEEAVSAEIMPAASSSKPKSTSSGKPAAKSISLNTASASELDRLPGVGPSTAAKIIEYRKAHGGFASIDELLAVKGIGAKKLKDMRPYLKL